MIDIMKTIVPKNKSKVRGTVEKLNIPLKPIFIDPVYLL